MNVSAECVANAFLDIAEGEGCALTNMQLQKLVYIAHGYCLALLNEPLIYNDVKAWQYGPVYPKLYKKLSKFGAGKVCGRIHHEKGESPSTEQKEIIDAVWKVYGRMTGGKLSALTHQPGSPWSQTWSSAPHTTIAPEFIKSHYQQVIKADGAEAK